MKKLSHASQYAARQRGGICYADWLSQECIGSAAKYKTFETRAIPEERRGGYRDYWMASDVLEATSHGYDGYVFDKNGKKQEFIGYRADAINNYAVHYLHEYSEEKTFFLFVSQIEPHHQNDHNRFEGS